MRISLGVTADFDSPPVTESDGNATDLPVENRNELFSEGCKCFGHWKVAWLLAFQNAINIAFEPSWQPTIAPSPCSVEPAFLAATSFGICVITTFPSESHQGIQRDTDCLGLMIRNFNLSRLTFKTTGQSWTRLPALTAS